MKVKELSSIIESYAPLKYQENYDNSGLQIGDPESEIRGVLLTIDITEDVIQEAIDKKCNFILSHHPLIFGRIKKVTGENYVERCIQKAIKNDLCLYACHTNMDKVSNGVSSRMAKKIGLVDCQILSLEKTDGENIGLGMIGFLSKEEDEIKFLERIKNIFNIECIRYTTLREKPIRKVALCGGSGHEFLNQAIESNADIYLSGDFKYHQFFEADNKIVIADIGHFESEQFTKEIFFEIVSKINPKFAIHFSDSKTNPINYL